jgi:hypothetical protein
MHPISSAIYAIQTAANFGYEGLKAFTLTREDPRIIAEDFDKEHETYDEFIERLATACWMGADYFKMWLGDENVNLQNHELKDLNLSDGVYYMNFEGYESHYWIWIIDGSDIWYAGTYGGVCDIIVKKFNKAEYNVRFSNAMNGSLSDYAYVFQVNPVVSEVGFQSLSYEKSNRY